MNTPTGLINQKIEIYSDQDVANDSGGVDPVLALYWATSAKVEQLSAGREIQANQEFIKPTIRFTVRDRIDKNVLPDMQVKYRNSMFIITSAIPDLVYNQELVIVAVSISTPTRVYNATNFIQWAYSDTDYYGNEQDIPFQFAKIVPNGSTSLVLPFIFGSTGKRLYVKVPEAFMEFDHYYIDELDYGDIPNVRWYPVVNKNGFNYYQSKAKIYLTNSSNTITFTKNV